MSKLFSLEVRDYIKGLVVALLASSVNFLYVFLTQGGNLSNVNWNELLNVAITAGLAYLIKNFFSDHEGKLGGKL